MSVAQALADDPPEACTKSNVHDRFIFLLI